VAAYFEEHRCAARLPLRAWVDGTLNTIEAEAARNYKPPPEPLPKFPWGKAARPPSARARERRKRRSHQASPPVTPDGPRRAGDQLGRSSRRSLGGTGRGLCNSHGDGGRCWFSVKAQCLRTSLMASRCPRLRPRSVVLEGGSLGDVLRMIRDWELALETPNAS
jgi:hypothetical protein